MSACIRCNELATFCARHAEERLRELRAEVADLKARLKAVRGFFPELRGVDSGTPLDRVTDLRRRNWRKP